MMALAKRIYILMIKVNKLIFFIVLQYFLKLGEFEKAYTCLRIMFPQHFSFSQTFTCISIKQLDYELEISITHRNRERII